MKAKKRHPIRNLVLLIFFFVVIGGVTFALIQDGEGPKTKVTAEEISTGDITSIVTATGRIFPQVEVRISSEVAGEIIEMPVVDGTEVKRGDLLVRVNPDTLEAQVKQQEAALQAQRAQSAQNRAQLLRTQQELRRTEELAANGFATEDQLEAARTSVEIQEASLEASQFRIEQQTMLLREVQDELSRASTFAAIDGTITRIDREVGDRVVGTGQFEGTLIMMLSDLTNMEVQVEVSESDIIDVELGDAVKVEIDALPDETFEGEVIEIANSAQTTESGSRDQLTTFLVKIGLLEPSAAIRPGMTATADIETETVEEVVRVPLQAVTVRTREVVRKALEPDDEDAAEDTAEAEDEPETPEASSNDDDEDEEDAENEFQRIVFVVNDGVAEMRVVETGISDGRFIEILEGLEAGETVVTGRYSVLTRELEHEDAVEVEEREDRRGNGNRD